MDTLRQIVSQGTIEQIEAAFARLRRLPEFGMRDRVERLSRIAAEMGQLREQLKRLDGLLLTNANVILDAVAGEWTADEISRACGCGL